MKNFIGLLTFTSLTVMGAAHAEGDIETGRELSTQCSTCHGAYGLSNSEQFPNIAGQKEAYLIAQLEKYKSGERTDGIMSAIVGPLSSQNINDLSAYYAANNPVATYTFDTSTLSIPYLNVGDTMYTVDMLLTNPTNLDFTVTTLNPL